MIHAKGDIAALVYDEGQDPDAILHDFAAGLKADNYRAVGMVQAGQCADSSLSAVLLHTGEILPLAQDYDPSARGCRLDIARLENAGRRIAEALERGADVVIINRFGKRERDGKGLGYLIDRAFESDVPVVIAVSGERFAEWAKFADGLAVKLVRDRHSLNAWWRGALMRSQALKSAQSSQRPSR